MTKLQPIALAVANHPHSSHPPHGGELSSPVGRYHRGPICCHIRDIRGLVTELTCGRFGRVATSTGGFPRRVVRDTPSSEKAVQRFVIECMTRNLNRGVPPARPYSVTSFPVTRPRSTTTVDVSSALVFSLTFNYSVRKVHYLWVYR